MLTREEKNTRRREHYRANQPRILAERAKWRAAHRPQIRAGQRAERARNPEKVRERCRQEWRNPDKWPRHAWRAVRKRAALRGWDFNLEPSDLAVPTVCPVLGQPFVFGPANQFSPSVDRIDNSRGYVRGNVAVISYRANQIKSDSTPEELALLLQYVTRMRLLAAG